MTRNREVASRRSLGTVMLGAAFSVGMILTSAQGFAMDNGVYDSGKTRSELEADGYKCEMAGVGFFECTKSGSQTYWCDSHGTCQPAPLRGTPPKRTIFKAPTTILQIK